MLSGAGVSWVPECLLTKEGRRGINGGHGEGVDSKVVYLCQQKVNSLRTSDADESQVPSASDRRARGRGWV